MAKDQLFKKLCTPEVLKVGWHLAHADSQDDFVLDPVGHADFASNLSQRLEHLCQEVESHRYRPRHLLDIDIPKSGLSVRPGNVLPIEEAVLLHSIVYLLAQKLDGALATEVFSYRLHKDWKKRVRKGASLFREGEEEIPFLRRATIRKIDPVESWYTAWPEFDAETARAFKELGCTHLTKTDITAYFENIDLRILETQVRMLLRREEDAIIQVLFRVLDGWTRVTYTGTPVGRGIPQGNDVSSFLGNLYLIPLDRALRKFCHDHDGVWCRYVDDVKVMTKSERDARAAVFVINESLRRLHLNLQGSKTKIISGKSIDSELYNHDLDLVNAKFKEIEKLSPEVPSDRKAMTAQLKHLSPLASRFRRAGSAVVTDLSGNDSRLFRRLLTVYGRCRRSHLVNATVVALRSLPELRLLQKSLRYLSQQDYERHDGVARILLDLVGSEPFMLPYHVGQMLEVFRFLHPENPKIIGSRLRKCGLGRRQHWYVRQKCAEALVTFPYREEWIETLTDDLLNDPHPLVRRAGLVLLSRATVAVVRKNVGKSIYHADPGLSRLAQYWHRFIQDDGFARQEIDGLMRGKRSESAFVYNIPKIYLLRCNPQQHIVRSLREYLRGYPVTKSAKVNWHIGRLLDLTEWAEVVAAKSVAAESLTGEAGSPHSATRTATAKDTKRTARL